MRIQQYFYMKISQSMFREFSSFVVAGRLAMAVIQIINSSRNIPRTLCALLPCRLTVVTIAMVMFSAGNGVSETSEYLLKAGFLEKFARFTDWPAESRLANDPEKPFILSVIGKNPFGDSLEALYTSGKIKGRSVKIRQIFTLWEIDGSDMLFVSASEDENLESILEYAIDKPILVVGDTDSFGERGCHINLYITGNQTLHFEINLERVKASSLHLQLLLLEYGKVLQ